MQIEYDNEILFIKCSGSQFQDQLESCRLMGMRYDPDKKAWTISAGKFNEVMTEMSQYKIDISEYDKKEIINYYNNICELKKITKRAEWRKFNQDLLLVEPIKTTGESFQYRDILDAINTNRKLFVWSTGTGKSYALAGILSHLRHYGEVNKAIILTSSIGVMNLSNELKKFISNYDETKTLVIDSITKLKDRLVFNQDYDIVICGYDTFRAIGDAYDKAKNNRKNKVKYRSSSLPLKEWFGNKKGIIFFDECHLLGSPNSLRSKFILMNLQYFEYRHLMSATPADKEEKMYMLLKCLDKKLVNGLDYYGWLSTYCELGNRWSKYGVNKDTWDQQKWIKLQDELYKNYAVKRGKELLNLPVAIDIPVIQLDMTKEHREIYEAFTYEVVNDIKARNASNNAGLVSNLLNTFQYLQLSVDNPLCLQTSPNFSKFNQKLQNAINHFNYEKSFNKLHALDNIIQEECEELEHKIIVFYYHPITLDVLRKHFPKAFVLSREVDKQDRFKLIEDFKKSKEKILLASILIANTSFTLTECKAAIFYERVWDYINYEQARGRIYRVGQTDEVRYYNMVYKNSIDNLQLSTLEKKGKVLDGLVKKDTLSPEEWKFIFNYDMNNQDFISKLI